MNRTSEIVYNSTEERKKRRVNQKSIELKNGYWILKLCLITRMNSNTDVPCTTFFYASYLKSKR